MRLIGGLGFALQPGRPPSKLFRGDAVQISYPPYFFLAAGEFPLQVAIAATAVGVPLDGLKI